MGRLRKNADNFAQWIEDSEDEEIVAGLGCGCFVIVVVLAAVFTAGYFFGAG